MSNQEKAAEVLRNTSVIAPHRGMDMTASAVFAEALADKGLLMPDLPEPDLRADDPAHRDEFSAWWEGTVPHVWNEGLPGEFTLQTFPGEPDVTIYRDLEPEETLMPAEVRRLAYALLAAANYAEKETP